MKTQKRKLKPLNRFTTTWFPGAQRKDKERFSLHGDPHARPDPKDLARLLEWVSQDGIMEGAVPTPAEDTAFATLFRQIMATGYRIPGVEPWLDDDCPICVDMKKQEIFEALAPVDHFPGSAIIH